MHITPLAAAAALTLSAVLGAPHAAAEPGQPCPDVEVVFARGSAEPPGVGMVGQQFVDALRATTPKTVGVYPVNYLAANLFEDRTVLSQSVVDGVRDATGHIQAIAADCPNTRIVLGGYSQGAAVAGFTTSDVVPPGISANDVPQPMPPQVGDHVAAVTLFGMPSAAWMQNYGAPPVVIGPLYVDKTIQLCNPGDRICDGDPGAIFSIEHLLYGPSGMVNQAAAFAAARL